MATRQRKWLGLGPEDVHGYYAVTVNIAPMLPSNRIAEGQFGLEQAQAKAISMKRHRQDFLKLPHPEEEEDDVLGEDFKASPEWRSLMMRRIADEMGLLDQMEDEQRKQQQEMLMQQLPPGYEQRLAMDQAPASAPGLPGAAGLAPMPGNNGMPLQPPPPEAPGLAGGMGGGRAAGVGIQPNTQMLPGGVPENA